jgi:hypothetical protein
MDRFVQHTPDVVIIPKDDLRKSAATKRFTMKEIQESAPPYWEAFGPSLNPDAPIPNLPLYSVIKGLVFDIRKHPVVWMRKGNGGADVTIAFANRIAVTVRQLLTLNKYSNH